MRAMVADGRGGGALDPAGIDVAFQADQHARRVLVGPATDLRALRVCLLENGARSLPGQRAGAPAPQSGMPPAPGLGPEPGPTD